MVARYPDGCLVLDHELVDERGNCKCRNCKKKKEGCYTIKSKESSRWFYPERKKKVS